MQLTWMQLKELLRKYSITLQSQCSIKDKCGQKVSKVVVVTYRNITVVNDVVVGQETLVLCRGRRRQTWQPCWIVATSSKHSTHATSCGKLVHLVQYKKVLFLRDAVHLAFCKFSSSFKTAVLFRFSSINHINGKKTIKKFSKIDKIYISTSSGELLDAHNVRKYTEVVLASVEGKDIWNVIIQFSRVRVLVMILKMFPENLSNSWFTVRFLIVLFSLLSMLQILQIWRRHMKPDRICRHLFAWNSDASQWTLPYKGQILFCFWTLRQQYLRCCRQGRLKTKLGNESTKERRARRVMSLLMNYFIQKDAILVFAFLDTGNIGYFCFQNFLNAKCSCTYVFLRTKQVFYYFSCNIWLLFLSRSSVFISIFSTICSCLRRSFREKCLNCIETHTKLKPFKIKFLFKLSWNHVYPCIYFFSCCLKGALIRLYLLSNFSKHIVYFNSNLNISHYYQFWAFFVKRVSLRYLLAQCGDVEMNPGLNLMPNHGLNPNMNLTNTSNVNDRLDTLVPKPVITIMTQNCRGLNDYNKMRLIIRHKNSMVNKTKMILALQETYLINDDWIKWSGNYVISKAASPHSAGCISYFNEDVRIIEVKQIDDLGHGHVAVIEGLLPNIVIFANIYSPVRSLVRDQENFYKNLLDIVEELELKYILNEPNLIIAGDFNIPLDKDRSMFGSDSEFERAMSLVQQFENKGLIDSWKEDDYRFTFKTAYSRLDRILYRLNVTYKEKLETDWTFTNSDHCLVKLWLNEMRTRSNKDRIVSLPTYLLDNEEATGMIRDKMTEMANQCESHWDAKLRLEYLKMCLRTIVGEVAKLMNRREKAELEDIQRNITWRIGLMHSLPLHAIESNKEQLDTLFTRRNLILDAKCKKLAKKAKTKWFYEGEKASKYFLNLLNKRRGQQEIVRLVTDRGEVTESGEIDAEINSFYKELYERGKNTNAHTDEFFYENVTKVDIAMAERVISPLSKDEIYQTLLTCRDSAPGPDGIPYSYYKKYWSFFGDVLAQSWSEALQSGTLPDSHKKSILRLLPKTGKDVSKLTN